MDVKAFDQIFTPVGMSDSHLSSVLLVPSYFIPDALMKEIQQAVDHQGKACDSHPDPPTSGAEPPAHKVGDRNEHSPRGYFR